MSTNRDDAFLNQSRQALDEHAKQASPQLQQSLQHLRQEALATQSALSPKSRSFFMDNWRWSLPASAAAFMALCAVLILPLTQPHKTLPPAQAFEQLSEEAVQLLSAEESLEMYQELEFMLWLDAEPLFNFPEESTSVPSKKFGDIYGQV